MPFPPGREGVERPAIFLRIDNIGKLPSLLSIQPPGALRTVEWAGGVAFAAEAHFTEEVAADAESEAVGLAVGGVFTAEYIAETVAAVDRIHAVARTRELVFTELRLAEEVSADAELSAVLLATHGGFTLRIAEEITALASLTAVLRAEERIFKTVHLVADAVAAETTAAIKRTGIDVFAAGCIAIAVETRAEAIGTACLRVFTAVLIAEEVAADATEEAVERACGLVFTTRCLAIAVAARARGRAIGRAAD